MSADLEKIMAPDWAAAMAPVAKQIQAMGDFLRAELRMGRGYLPPGEQVFRAFTYPLSQVKVLVVGQDPYPTSGHAIGLAFAAAPEVRPLPKSLANIYKELRTDLVCAPPPNADLRPWAAQGVMLLNRVLTVRPGTSGSHRGKGWEEITAHAINILASRAAGREVPGLSFCENNRQPLVAILWGNEARKLKPLLDGVPVLESAHPSPLSASRGFFGSRPFSRANELLLAQGAAPVDWGLSAWQTT